MKHLITRTLLLLWMLPALAHNVGDTAPDFTLNTLDGSTVTLSQLQGKVVMVFFFGYNCPSCVGAGPAIQGQLVDAFKDNSNFVALAIDKWNGNKNGVQNFKDASQLNIPMLMQGAAVSTQWESERDRILVVDANGKFAFVGKNNAVNDIAAAKTAISTALASVSTSVEKTEIFGRITVQPNPAKNSAQFTLQLNKPGQTQLTLYDMAGKKVLHLFSGQLAAGEHTVNFQRNQLPDGVYFYRLETATTQRTGKLILH